jgi:long-chain acyl-CoA synthetase
MNPSDRRRRAPETLQALARDLGRAGERDAIVFSTGQGIERWNFRELAARVGAQARTLAAKGVGADDPVILCGGGADWMVGCLAVLRCGACVVPVDSQLAAETFRHVVKDCGARLALVSRQAASRYKSVLDEAGLETLPLSGPKELRDADGVEFPTVDAGARALLCYTSGTTGPPKGVPLSHRNVVFQIGVLADAGLVTPDDRVLLPLPLHHVYPLVIGMLTPLALGLAVVLPDGFTGPRIVAALREGRATLMIGVPRLYSALVGAIEQQFGRRGKLAAGAYRLLIGLARFLRRRLHWRAGRMLFAPIHRRFGPSLRTVVSGGAALRPDIAWTLEALGWHVGTGYGLTETSPMLTLNPPGRARLDTAGRAAPGVELRIDPGDGDKLPLGEVQARGPGVFAGYHGLPEKTEEAFTADGWFRTGDLGRIDDGGWLHLAGRGASLIVTEGGENVQPDVIEDAYAEHPAIAELAVFENEGQVAALIVPDPALARDGKPDEAVREAVRTVSRGLPSYQRLAEYRLTREAIPRTRLGKPQIHLVAERYRRALQGISGDAKPREPAAIDEFSSDDQALLENETAYDAFMLMVGRFTGRRVTPDSHLQLDLGVDSIEWLDLSFELSEKTGIALPESAMAEVQTVRDLLVQVAHGGSGAPPLSLDDPEAMLDESQRRWLEPRGPGLRALGRALAAINRGAMRVMFRLTVKGIETLPPEGPYVLAPNHASYLDPFALASSLSTERLERTYWAGWTGVAFGGPCRRAFSRVAQIVPIDPARATASSLAFAGAALQRGHGLVWFPEGVRSWDGRLQPFKAGLGRVLERRRAAVVPVVIRGSHAAWSRARWLPRLSPLQVEFLPAVSVDDLASEGRGASEAARIVEALQRRIAGAL